MQYELIYHVFGPSKFGRITANLDLFLRRFNEVQFWVVTEMLLVTNVSKRVQLLRKLIKLASQWVHQGSFLCNYYSKFFCFSRTIYSDTLVLLVPHFFQFHFSISRANSLNTGPFILFMHSDVINLSHCASYVDQFELLHTC